MRFWNGYNVETLEKRGWAKIRVTLDRLATLDDDEFLGWLEEDRPGRYFVDGVWGIMDPQHLSRDYYFEDHETATLFALKWM